MNRYYGKYRAIVKETCDPEKRGRIRVDCPSVYGEGNISKWCLPCFTMGIFAIPPIGSTVWIEFEEGDKNNPIWNGVFYTQTVFAELYDAEKYDPKCLMIRAYKDITIRCPDTLKLNDVKDKSGKITSGEITIDKKKVQTQ